MSLRSRALTCLVLLMILAACGAPPAPPAVQPTAAPTAVGPTEAPAASAYPVTITDDRGPVTIPAPPERVVTISEEMTELAVALGVQPVGFGSSRHEATEPGQPLAGPLYLDPAQLGSPTFVGTLEPSVERIVALDPDLILYINYEDSVYQQLSQVAPTLGFEPSGDGAWQRIIGEVGKALGREERAAEVVAEFEARKAELKEQLAPIVDQTPRVTLLYLSAPDSTFVFNENFAFGGMLADLGFTLVVPEGVDPGERGAVTISPEALASLDTDVILTLQFSEGVQDGFPVEPILASLGKPVLRTVLEQERPYTGPFSERFYLESFTGLLAGGASAAPASAQFPLTIAHALGATTLEAPAQRIVALEWTYVENLLALGVQPVGVADIAGYNDWVSVPVALAPAVQDVGMRQEPSLEQIAALKPDLIIAPSFRVDANYAELNAIAPTVAFDPYPADEALTQYDEMIQTFRAIARAVGREAEGEAALTQMEATFAAQADRVAAAGAAGEPFVLAQAFSGSSGAAEVRLFTENALATQIVERLGLENAWEDAAFQQYGFSTVSVEALPKLGEARFFYVVQDEDDVFAAGSVRPLWESLPFVRAGKAHALGGDTWLFGGPLSAELLATLVADTMLAANE